MHQIDDRQRKLPLGHASGGDRFISDEHRHPQAFHLDEEQAQHSFFLGLAAGGWHTAAITMKLLVTNLPVARGIFGADGEISQPQPMCETDVLHVESEVF